MLIVGAILAPVTGGTSFGCALITATKITIGASLCSGLGTLAIETAMGLVNGKGFEERCMTQATKVLMPLQTHS